MSNNDAKPAVFLDRDGVLNIDAGYVYRSEDFIWTEGAREAVRLLNERGYLVFVVTNQSGVARGCYRETDVQRLHNWMKEDLVRITAHIDAFYYCPHHPEALVESYRQICDCRKPAPGMILRAMREWPVDETQSFLIGNKEEDIAAAEHAAIGSFLFRGPNLYQFVLSVLSIRS
jgi:D-glycero-D-manno-heptose 1,7-bisphosphate phosphatase